MFNILVVMFLVMRLDRDLLSAEAERKLFHIAWAVDPLLYYFGYPRDGMLLLIGCQLLIWIGFEAARRMGFSAFSTAYMRPAERRGAPMGTLFQVASLFLAVLLFDKAVAIIAMVFNCVGDSIVGLAGAVLSPYVGVQKAAVRDIGSKGLRDVLKNHKAPVLMAVMFLACIVPGFILFPRASPLLMSLGALGAVAADAFAWRLFGYTLNDDLTITLAAGGAMAAAAYF